MSWKLAAALDYAAHGLRVLPGNGKRALIDGWPENASSDPGTVRAWWQKWPDATVGVLTGELESGGYLVVLDIDGDGGADALHELEAEHGTLPDTPRVTTPRGEHYWFASPVEVRNSASVLGPGLDVRGAGGYVIAPPSPGYQWDMALDEAELAELPDWLIGRMLHANGRRVNTASPNRPVPEGQRDNTLASLAGSMRWRGMSSEAIEAALTVENAARCVPPLPKTDIRRIAASIGRYEPERPGGQTDQNTYAGRVLNVASLLAEPDTPVPWRCDRLAADGYLTVLAGRGGEGKSWLTLALACGVARGRPVAGIPCTEGTALIFDAENGRDQIRRRLRAAGVTPAIPVQPVEAGGLNITRPGDLGWIRETIEQYQARVVVLDSLRVLSSGVKEDDSGAMEPVITNVKLLARETGAAVILVHHRGRSESSDFRGSSVILDQTDLLFTITRAKGDPQGRWRRSITAVKCRIDEEPAQRWVAIEADRGRQRVNLVETDPFEEASATPARDALRTQVVAQLTDDPQPTARIAQGLGRGKNDGTVRRILNDLAETGETQRGDSGGWRLPRVTPQGRGNPGNPSESPLLEPNPGLPRQEARGRGGNPQRDDDERSVTSASGEHPATPKEAEVERVRAKYPAAGESADDLSDLGCEQALPNPAPKAHAPKPCKCLEGPLVEPDNGTLHCARCGLSLSEAS